MRILFVSESQVPQRLDRSAPVEVVQEVSALPIITSQEVWQDMARQAKYQEHLGAAYLTCERAALVGKYVPPERAHWQWERVEQRRTKLAKRTSTGEAVERIAREHWPLWDKLEALALDLSDAERRVIELVKAGAESVQALASALQVTEGTASFHVCRIREKIQNAPFIS